MVSEQGLLPILNRYAIKQQNKQHNKQHIKQHIKKHADKIPIKLTELITHIQV